MRFYLQTYENTYHNFTEEQLAKEVRAMQHSISKKQASRVYQIARTLTNRCFGRHTEPRSNPTILSPEEEVIIPRTLDVVADWGFPLTKAAIKRIVKTILYKKDVISVLKDNLPKDDMVASFVQRNNLSEDCIQHKNIPRFC